MSATGLSADPREYRSRLEEQADQQIDAWAAELMRDMSIRRGVLSVLAEFRHAAQLDEAGLQRVFSAGGGRMGDGGPHRGWQAHGARPSRCTTSSPASGTKPRMPASA